MKIGIISDTHIPAAGKEPPPEVAAAFQDVDLPGNVAVNPGQIGAPAYMAKAQLDELHASGWSIVSHGMTHDSLPSLSAGELDYELRASQEWIDAQGYRGSNVFVVPFHVWGARERDAILRVEGHALALQKGALESLGPRVRARADLAARVEHAMPRHARVVERRERVADLARLAWQPRQLRDLAIGGDAALRDLPHHGVDARVAGRGRHRRATTRIASPTRAAPGSTTRQ